MTPAQQPFNSASTGQVPRAAPQSRRGSLQPLPKGTELLTPLSHSHVVTLITTQGRTASKIMLNQTEMKLYCKGMYARHSPAQLSSKTQVPVQRETRWCLRSSSSTSSGPHLTSSRPSLAAQWFTTPSSSAGVEFDPWLRSEDPLCFVWENRSSTVTSSIKTLKMVHLKKKKLLKKHIIQNKQPQRASYTR